MNGVNFKIYANKGTQEQPEYVSVGGQRGGKLNRSGDTVDVTTKDDNGWKASRVGLLEWSIDGDGILIDGDEAFGMLEEAFLSGEYVDVKIGDDAGWGFEGKAIITDFPVEAPYDDALSYSMTLQGTGVLNKIGAFLSSKNK